MAVQAAQRRDSLRNAERHPNSYNVPPPCEAIDYADRRPKSPCTSKRILRALCARTLDISSGCVVSTVSTLRSCASHGNCHSRSNQNCSAAQINDQYSRGRAAANRTSANGDAVSMRTRRTLCRYSYATSVNPNWGLLRMIRAGPPLKNALKPSSRSTANSVNPSTSGLAVTTLTDLRKRVHKALVVSLARPCLHLQTRLNDI